MYKVEVVKRCGCFTKSNLPYEYKFDSFGDASQKARELVEKFNKEFCGKHQFKIEEDATSFKIIEDEDA